MCPKGMSFFDILHKIFIPSRRQAKSLTLPKDGKQLHPKLADKLQPMTSCQSLAVLEMGGGQHTEMKNDSWKPYGEQDKGQLLCNPSAWFSLVKVISVSKVTETTCKSYPQ